MPVDTLLSNGAYLVMAALADAQGVVCVAIAEDGPLADPVCRGQSRGLRMEFKASLHAFVLMPVQVVRASRRLVFRLLAWNPWQAVFLRGFDQLHEPLGP